ncbi:radical SAM/SPASM domain-containing protein [Prevotella sp.]|uniref:radical SAM/SPASM domain-containing protein n=1 Tax=Prevotella sp. TaxID=59823 RepID=UPI00264874CB|nr:radical SAM protein [Prevotella sp.]MDN5553704.1 4Fe-4S cluster-binding domain-containing protein [Prevotella sp.]
MIWSKYNELIKKQDDSFFLFNSRTKKWLTLVRELYVLLSDNYKNIDEISTIHPELFESLVKNDFVVKDTNEETSKCIAELGTRLEFSNTLKLTINPTLDCNLRCWYCYEGHLHGSVMQSQTIDNICKYITEQLEKHRYERLQLAFFGGEPLLKFTKVVQPILQNVHDICIHYDTIFVVSFTTNGVCLTQKVRNGIKKSTTNVSFQIPFDGDFEMHNKVKKFYNEQGSYNIVTKNAREAVLDGFRVIIRCNYTKENIRSFQKVIADFNDLVDRPNLRFSFHKVWQETEDEELKIGIKELKANIAGIKFQSNINSYFGDSVNPCYGDYMNNYVFNYNGDVFKCTARDFAPEHRIGKLTETGVIDFNNLALQRVKKSMTSECYTCRRLPICPICSQLKYESIDGKCPVHITPNEISMNIQDYFTDVLYQHHYEKISK